jgi:endoglucanase
VTAFCDRVGAALAQRRKSFAYQRKLMDGGTCESTAYYVYGYATTGACVALGNYHNMDVENKKIASEYISLSDWQRMVDWFEAMVLDETGYTRVQGKLRSTIDERFEKYRPLFAT